VDAHPHHLEHIDRARDRAHDRARDRQRAVAGFDHITDLFIAHLQRRKEARWDTLSCICADPLRGRELVAPLGLQPYHFEDDDDLRLIYSAVLVAAQRGKEIVIRLAWRALVEHYGGVEHGDVENPSVGRWSHVLLVNFFTKYPGAYAAGEKAKRLIDLYERHHAAADCWRKIHDLLRGDNRPWGGVVIAPASIKRKSRSLNRR
jgi:hypothetical protein